MPISCLKAQNKHYYGKPVIAGVEAVEKGADNFFMYKSEAESFLKYS